jgi:predicted DNA-binding transcriptional regulator AlpA
MQALIDDKSLQAGVYSFRDLQSLGLVKDRTDLQRKQKRYGFPKPIKLGDRQAAFLRTEVAGWVKERAADRRQVAQPEAETAA